VKGVSAGHAALEALREDSKGKIHSVFERSFNILIKNRLVGVARNDIPVSPIDLITNVPTAETMPNLGVRKGMGMKITGNRVFFGDVLEISLDEVRLWRPPTRVKKPLGREHIKRNLNAVKKGALAKAEGVGLGQLLLHLDSIIGSKIPDTKELNDVTSAALPHLLGFLKSVKSGDVDGVKENSKNLVGLGPGLTPSADDMLGGFASALWWVSNSFGKVDRIQEINNAISSQAAATNLLSHQLLEHATRGEVNEYLVDFFEEILAGTGKNLDKSVGQIMAIGETSGADSMVGLILGIEIGLDQIL